MLVQEQHDQIVSRVGWAQWYVRRYARRGIDDRDDLHGHALEALCLAVRNYDPGRGTSLGAHVHARMGRAIIDRQRHADALNGITRHARDAGDYEPAVVHGVNVDHLPDPMDGMSLSELLGPLDRVERAIVIGTAVGLTNREIAAHLGVHPSRVSQRLPRIREKIAAGPPSTLRGIDPTEEALR
jgi:RNA polymerase sigma factor (sigma-70 family)